MAQFFLINTVLLASGTKLLAGELVDDAVTPTAPITAAGGLLWPASDVTVAAAAAQAQNAHKNRGANEAELNAIMLAAVDAVQKANDAASVLATRSIGTTAPLTGGGDLSADRTLAISAATGATAGSMSAADKAKLDTVQHGTGVLVAGVSAAIAATITANSRIVVTRKDPLASTAIGFMSALSADRVVGAPGSFKATALTALGATETNDVSTFDWHVIN